MTRYAQALSRQLFDFDRPETLGQRLHFRILEFFFVGYTIWFCWTWGAYIQRNITEVMLPLGIANYIDVSFLFDGYLALGNAALVTLFCLVAVTRVWRPAYAVVLGLFHLQYVARYSQGEISHGSNLIGTGILVLAVAALLYDNRKALRRFTFGALYFLIGVGYTSAAVCKLIGTGVTWPDGRHLLMWMMERKVDLLSRFGAFEPNVLQELVLQNYHWGTLFLVFGLIAEASAFGMWFRKTRYPVTIILVGMHLGVAVTMNIVFAEATYTLLLLALPWGIILDRVLERVPALRPRTKRDLATS